MGVLGCVICVAGYPLSVSGTHTRPLKGETSPFLPPLNYVVLQNQASSPTQGGIQIDWITEGKT